MKKVTFEAAKCFKNCKNFHKSNTSVENSLNWQHVYFYLHGNCIASYSKKSDCLLISDCWRSTNTTKERLNWILDEFNLWRIFQKDFQWFYSSKDWAIEKFNWKKQFDWVVFNESSRKFNELMKARLLARENQN